MVGCLYKTEVCFVEILKCQSHLVKKRNSACVRVSARACMKDSKKKHMTVAVCRLAPEKEAEVQIGLLSRSQTC